MKMTVCFNQAMRPMKGERNAGCGDCQTCVPDEANKNCVDYYPITLWCFIAKEKEDDVLLHLSPDVL